MQCVLKISFSLFLITSKIDANRLDLESISIFEEGKIDFTVTLMRN